MPHVPPPDRGHETLRHTPIIFKAFEFGGMPSEEEAGPWEKGYKNYQSTAVPTPSVVPIGKQTNDDTSWRR